MIRLVKGAYWDTEVKRAQERGLADYPVFTRKAMTDWCYLDCAQRLLAARPRLYPQFATHNALTVASVIEMAGGVGGYEFQRLHGMGVELYDALRARLSGRGMPRLCAGRRPSRPARLSGAAAVGERRQYLVRVGVVQSGHSDRDLAQAPARLSSTLPNRRGIRTSRCRAICTNRSGAIRRAWNSAIVPVSMRCWRKSRRRSLRMPRIRSWMATRWRRRKRASRIGRRRR